MKVLVTELWTKAEFLDAGVSEHMLIFAYESSKEETICKCLNSFDDMF